MRAVRVGRFGEPADVVEVGDVDPPTPGPGEALVRGAAGSLNFGGGAIWGAIIGAISGLVIGFLADDSHFQK